MGGAVGRGAGARVTPEPGQCDARPRHASEQPQLPRARALRRGPWELVEAVYGPDGTRRTGQACMRCRVVPWPRMALMRSTSLRGLKGLVM